MCREVGCVGRDTRASGLGAGRGSIFHLDDNHTVSAPYFAGKLYLCFWYFSVITDMTQIHVEEGKREKERAEVIKGSPLFQRNTHTPVPTLHTTHMMLGEGDGQGDLRKAELILSPQSGAT